jgi:hypothetical protein
MIDPITSLAFSIHSGRGIYALLLGSGISRAAQIPTGWEVTLDLIKKVAAVEGEECEPDPASWYVKKFGKDPDYSELLAGLALMPAERTNALRGYFEATVEDLEEGKKMPTIAHKVIARLVKAGYFRVIVTTNFDRLLEQALVAEGVDAMVISTADMAIGATPLVHSNCTVVKVHGDYRDNRLKNTSQELSAYDPEMNRLLDRVFDEYGLVICGWSATWDSALRTAILRCPNRRYSTLWVAKGTVSDEAAKLIKFRAASVLSVESADKFFLSLEEKLESLERLNTPHPLSATLAVASLKRFLVEDRFRIQLNDFVMGEVERQISQLSTLGVAVHSLQCEALYQRLAIYEGSTQILLSLIAHGCYWGTEDQAHLWSHAIIRLLDLAPPAAGTTVLLNLRKYPALMALYAGGIACVAAGCYRTLKVLFRDSRTSVDVPFDGKDEMLIRKLVIHQVLPLDELNSCSNQRWKTPGSDRLHKELRETFRPLIPNDPDYEITFDRWEYLLSLVGYDTRDDGGYFWPVVGRFGWRNRGLGRDGASVITTLSKEHEKLGSSWEPIAGGLFENSERFSAAEKGFGDQSLANFSPY